MSTLPHRDLSSLRILDDFMSKNFPPSRAPYYSSAEGRSYAVQYLGNEANSFACPDCIKQCISVPIGADFADSVCDSFEDSSNHEAFEKNLGEAFRQLTSEDSSDLFPQIDISEYSSNWLLQLTKEHEFHTHPATDYKPHAGERDIMFVYTHGFRLEFFDVREVEKEGSAITIIQDNGSGIMLLKFSATHIAHRFMPENGQLWGVSSHFQDLGDMYEGTMKYKGSIPTDERTTYWSYRQGYDPSDPILGA